jgi:adenine-specific DNA-methyltransferase
MTATNNNSALDAGVPTSSTLLPQHGLLLGSPRVAAKASQPSRQQVIRAIRAFKPLIRTHRVDAATVAGTLLRLWCRIAFPLLRAPRLPFSDDIAQSETANHFVQILQRLPFFDAAYWLSTAYAALSTDVHRKAYALYFTPPVIAERLIEDLKAAGVDFATDRFIDPACGGAAFLAIVADQMRTALRKLNRSSAQILDHVTSHLVGIDIDPVLATLSRFFLQMTFYKEISARRRPVHFRISQGDALIVRKLKGRFDVVLCNPPFRKLSLAETSKFREKHPTSDHVPPNLYTLFIELTTRLARAGGYVGLVTPTSFMSGRNFSPIRTFLLANTQVAHIGVVTDRERVYLDVQQETALTVFKTNAGPRNEVVKTALSLVESNGTYQMVGRCRLPNSGSSWPIAREASDVRLIASITDSPFRITDYGYAPSIGSFVWNRDIDRVYMTKNHVPRLHKEKVIPLLWSSDVRPDGTLEFESHATMSKQQRFISPAKTRTLVHQRPGVILQRVTSNDQPKRLVGAPISDRFLKKYGGYIGENHTVILEQENPEPILSPPELIELLACETIDRYFRSISGSTNVSTFELGQLPLPDPARLRARIDAGESIAEATRELLLS